MNTNEDNEQIVTLWGKANCKYRRYARNAAIPFWQKLLHCCRDCNWMAKNEKRKQQRKQKVLDRIKGKGTGYITIKQALQLFTTTRSTIRRLIIKHFPKLPFNQSLRGIISNVEMGSVSFHTIATPFHTMGDS